MTWVAAPAGQAAIFAALVPEPAPSGYLLLLEYLLYFRDRHPGDAGRASSAMQVAYRGRKD
jgi:hypothetical protein